MAPVKNFSFFTFQKILFLWLQGARLKTLPVILIPISLSSAFAFHQTNIFQTDIFFFTLLSALFIQISANLFNDAFDAKEGLDGALRKGPPRLVQTGQMSFKGVKNLAFISLALAFLFGIPLILRGGWLLLILGVFSILGAYFYTAPSFSFVKKGLAEMAVFLFFGFAAVFGAYYLQSLDWKNVSLIYLSLQCGFWALTVLLINYLRDEEEDKKTGRKHFVTHYGRTHSLFALVVLQTFIYLLCFFWMGQNLKSGAFSFFTAPLSAGLLYFICTTPPSRKYNLYLALAGLIYTLFGGAWILGILF